MTTNLDERPLLEHKGLELVHLGPLAIQRGVHWVSTVYSPAMGSVSKMTTSQRCPTEPGPTLGGVVVRRSTLACFPTGRPTRRSDELCRWFNEGRCRLASCRYTHAGRADITWWREFVESWNGVSFLQPLQPLPTSRGHDRFVTYIGGCGGVAQHKLVPGPLG